MSADPLVTYHDVANDGTCSDLSHWGDPWDLAMISTSTIPLTEIGELDVEIAPR